MIEDTEKIMSESTMVALTSQRRILDTPEILESILLQLPIRDLLVSAQRTNHAWHNLISSSPAIQEALFFQERRRNSGLETSFNPLLQASFAPWFKKAHEEEEPRRIPGIVFQNLDWNRSDAKREAYSRKEASWRKMLPVQPAVKRLEVIKYTSSMGGTFECNGEANFEEGVRMGVLYDLAQNETRRPITKVGVRWVPEDIPGSSNALETNLELCKEKSRVIMTIGFTAQCARGMPDSLGPQFKSLGDEEIDVKWGERRRMRR